MRLSSFLLVLLVTSGCTGPFKAPGNLLLTRLNSITVSPGNLIYASCGMTEGGAISTVCEDSAEVPGVQDCDVGSWVLLFNFGVNENISGQANPLNNVEFTAWVDAPASAVFPIEALNQSDPISGGTAWMGSVSEVFAQSAIDSWPNVFYGATDAAGTGHFAVAIHSFPLLDSTITCTYDSQTSLLTEETWTATWGAVNVCVEVGSAVQCVEIAAA